MATEVAYDGDTDYTSAGIDCDITNLKAKFGSDCRVINNIGEFLHVITVTLKEWNIKLKFQITGGYPSVPVDVVVSGGTTAVESLITELNQYLQKRVATVAKYVELSCEWLAVNGISCVQETEQQDSNKKKPKKSKPAVNDDKNTSKKKPSMKTSDDVIKRIKWDSHVNQEDFTIGYIDRFLGLMEKSFTTFSWEDLASVDDFTALAIPKHRIQYFKYRGVIVWDKSERIDNVFGSTGSGLTLWEVKEQVDNAPTLAVPTGSQVPGPNNNSDSDSDEDSDVEVSCNSRLQSTINEQQGRLCDRKKPNYFVCLRITNPDICEKVQAMQSAITKIDPRFVKCYSNSITLHLTLCTLGLDTDYQVRNACQALNGNRESLIEIARRKISFRVVGVDHFYGRVVYAGVKSNVDLDELIARVIQIMNNAGVDIRDSYDFVPHVTVMKLSKSLSGFVGANQLPPFTYRNFRDTQFGVQTVSSLDLCAMTNERSDSGFYVTPLHLELLSDCEPVV